MAAGAAPPTRRTEYAWAEERLERRRREAGVQNEEVFGPTRAKWVEKYKAKHKAVHYHPAVDYWLMSFDRGGGARWSGVRSRGLARVKTRWLHNLRAAVRRDGGAAVRWCECALGPSAAQAVF